MPRCRPIAYNFVAIMERSQLQQHLPGSIARLIASIEQITPMRRLNRGALPSRENASVCIEQLLQLVFPGFFGKQGLTSDNLPYRTGEIALQLADVMFDQIRFCLRYRIDRPDDSLDKDCMQCDRDAARITAEFFDRIPAVREMLQLDVQAAFDSDPAAVSTDETIFCYPGILAITVQRLSHELYVRNVPLLPRIWCELAHSRTGIDMHPGAKLGSSFFIDHGTGIVIGETAVIGNNVKLYQGVTLGALSPAAGQKLRGTRRHPTIEDNVTIYAHATILGGDTVIGKGATIGGNVFITESVPPATLVVMEKPKLQYRDRSKRKTAGEETAFDFQI
jgi:serine O-acetyltransferase